MSKKKTEHSDKYKPTAGQIKAVLDFAIAYKCVIDPLGYLHALEGFNEFGSCVCDKTRPTCPCTVAPMEIAEKGHCKCRLFWANYGVYIKEKKLDKDKCFDCNGAGQFVEIGIGLPHIMKKCQRCNGLGIIKAGGN